MRISHADIKEKKMIYAANVNIRLSSHSLFFLKYYP
jgi:hypothetical protein